MSKKCISVRIDEEVFKKLAYIAETEERSISNQVFSLIHKKIKLYESVHGAIVDDAKSEVEGKAAK